MLNDHTLARFRPFAGDLVAPLNDGYAFAAIAPTIEHLFGAPARDPLLPVDCFGGAYPQPKRIVTILVDCFGFEFWQRYAARSRVMSRVLREGILTPISALFPSTTAGSVSTLNLGVPPAVHALYEWNIYIPAYGETIQSLAFTTLGADPEPCETRGYDVRAMFMAHETVHTRVGRRGVRAMQLAHRSYAYSAVNSVISVGAELKPHGDLGEAFRDLRAAMARPPDEPELIGWYWAGLDAVAHYYGPGSPEFEAATLDFWAGMDQVFDGLDLAHTLVLFTADHGHVGTPVGDTLYVNERWPQLKDWLAVTPGGQIIWPNGSPRDMFLHIRPERRADALALLRDGLDGLATVITTDEAVAAGLFGPGEIVPELRRRLGDVLVLPHGHAFIWWREPGLITNPFNGHHGGLSREEMVTVLGAFGGALR